MNPDCAAGKHHACRGDGWDFDTDAPCACPCECHQITREDVLRTRVVLAQIAGEQERLGARLAASGLTEFVDRADWLIQHRNADEHTAWVRRWAQLGLTDPEPACDRNFWAGSLSVPTGRNKTSQTRPQSLSVPKRAQVRVHRFEDWQLRVAAEWAERRATA